MKWKLLHILKPLFVPLSLSFYLLPNSSEQLSQWDSPMRVKLSVWKPCVKTLLIELLPWALLINQSKWDLWLFEGEKIVLQVPTGKVMIPPNFEVTAIWVRRHSSSPCSSPSKLLQSSSKDFRHCSAGLTASCIISLSLRGCVDHGSTADSL